MIFLVEVAFSYLEEYDACTILLFSKICPAARKGFRDLTYLLYYDIFTIKNSC